MLGLDLPNLVAPETDLNLARLVEDGYVNRAKTVIVPPHILYGNGETKFREMGDLVFDSHRGKLKL
jgi:hypothetical protein